MAAQLQGIAPSRESAVAAVRNSRAAAKHRTGDADFPAEDVEFAAAIDTFDFAMRAEQRGLNWVAKRHPIDGAALAQK
jgi:hypothetical protein